MKKEITEEQLKKIIKKASKSLLLEEVRHESSNFQEFKEFFNNQNFLNNKNINLLFQFNRNSKYPIGYIIKDFTNNIVGFMGTLFYEKIIEKKITIFCNIHSWIVNKKYRLNSFFLITPLLKEKYNLTAFTPVKSLEGLLEKFGFKKKILIFKFGVNINFIRFNNNKFKIETDKNIIFKYLNHAEINEYQKYLDKRFYKFIILNKYNSKYIFFICKKIKKRFMYFLNFFYISNINELSSNWGDIKNIISKKFNIIFFSEYYFDIDQSFLPNNLFYKISKKNIYTKTITKLDKFDIRNSDLLIS